MISNDILRKKILTALITDKNYPMTNLSKLVNSNMIGDGDWILSDDMCSESNNNLIQLGSIGYGEYISKPFKHISDDTFEKLNCSEINESDLLINRFISNNMLTACLVPKLDGRLLTSVDVCWIKEDNNKYLNKYLMYCLLTPDVQQKILLKSSGTTRIRISKKNLTQINLPLPPLEEQYKIVEKIEELFDLIDRKSQNDIEKEELKEVLKEKVLDSAVKGVLVKQNINDESSDILVKHILSIRDDLIAKKELRKDSKINTKIPYEKLPNGWSWIRLGDIGIFKKGPFGSSLTKDMFVEDRIDSFKVYEQKNAIQKDWKLGNYFITKEKFDSMQSFVVKPNDIIVSCAGTIGEIYVIPNEARVGIINQALMKITLHDTSIMKYFLIYFDHVLKGETREKGKGSAITNIPPFDVLKNIYIPLPPLEEQHRIVEKIEECFKLIEQL